MLKPSPNWSSGCSRCPMKTHRAAGKRPCAISTHIGLIGSSSRDSISHGAADPLGQRAARTDRSRSRTGRRWSRCITWLKTISSTGATVIISEIAHYEVRRELLRIRRLIGSLQHFEYYLDPSGGLRHLTLTTDVIIKAAEFWAFLRQSGIPTASPDALDADAILAGQRHLPASQGIPSPSRRPTWRT